MRKRQRVEAAVRVQRNWRVHKDRKDLKLLRRKRNQLKGSKMDNFLKERDLVKKTLEKFTAYIGGHADMVQMKKIFCEVDTDGSGELDKEEFREAMYKFGMNFPSHEIDKLFDVLDQNGDDTLQFEEFAVIAEGEMELAQVNAIWKDEQKKSKEMGGSDLSYDEKILEEEMQKKVAALVIKAVHSGTRFTHSSGAVSGDMKLQGSALMLTPEALRERENLKNDRDIQRMVKNWWEGFWRLTMNYRMKAKHLYNKQQLNQDRHLKERQFLTMMCALSNLVDPTISEEEAHKSAKLDWLSDKQPHLDHMDLEDFYGSVFELCDTWVDSLDRFQYVDCLRKFQTAHLEAEQNLLQGSHKTLVVKKESHRKKLQSDLLAKEASRSNVQRTSIKMSQTKRRTKRNYTFKKHHKVVKSSNVVYGGMYTGPAKQLASIQLEMVPPHLRKQRKSSWQPERDVTQHAWRPVRQQKQTHRWTKERFDNTWTYVKAVEAQKKANQCKSQSFTTSVSVESMNVRPKTTNSVLLSPGPMAGVTLPKGVCSSLAASAFPGMNQTCSPISNVRNLTQRPRTAQPLSGSKTLPLGVMQRSQTPTNSSPLNASAAPRLGNSAFSPPNTRSSSPTRMLPPNNSQDPPVYLQNKNIEAALAQAEVLKSSGGSPGRRSRRLTSKRVANGSSATLSIYG